MGFVNCKICGNRMLDRVGNNAIIKNGSIQHKKCPKKKIKEEDLAIYKKLKDTIVEAFIEYGSPEARKRGLNWLFINSQINNLLTQGFSYDDIIYSFEQCINRDKIFWGFGRVYKFIEQDTATRKKIAEAIARSKPPEEVKFEYKGDDFNW